MNGKTVVVLEFSFQTTDAGRILDNFKESEWLDDLRNFEYCLV